MANCIFCEIVSGKLPGQKVHEDDLSLVFKDIEPQAPVHLLIIPKKHLARLSESSDDDAALLGHLQRVAARIAAEQKLSDYRLVTNNGRVAHQTVDHLHYHLLSGRPMLWPPG